MERKRRFDELENFIDEILENGETTHGLRRALRNLKKELVCFRNYQESIKKKKYTVGSSDCIQIGGGTHLLEGYMNIDIMPPADLIWDIREGIPLKDQSVTKIFSEHFLEHIDYPISVKKFLSECARILKPEGELIIGVPNSTLIVDGYIKRDKDLFDIFLDRWYGKRNCVEHINTYIDLVNYHFRDQDDDEKYHPHLWAYDYEKLEFLFRENGFIDINQWKFDPHIANPKREFGSIYVRGKKEKAEANF